MTRKLRGIRHLYQLSAIRKPTPTEIAMIDTLSLDGFWDFAFEGPTIRAEAARVRSPGIWQTQLPQTRNASGVGRYRRPVEIPAEWRGRSIHLVLEGVFHESVVLVDGVEIARHGDGWTTLDVDLTAALAGKSEFILGIDATLPDERGLGAAALGETLAAKQDWYGLQGGVWKPARLEARAPLHIAQCALDTRCEGARGIVRARGVLSQPGGPLRLTLRRDGAEVARADYALTAAGFDVELTAENVALWSPDTPALYEVEVALPDHILTRTLGFRRFEAREGKLWLNGEPFLMFGALDQDWHPQEECRPPSPDFLEQRFRNAKAMGLNTVRCHVKIPDKLYFDLADRLGLIVWLDMPYGEFLTPVSRETLSHVFHASVADHAHHPSICIWTLCNEGWGIDLDDNPDDRAWLKTFFDEAKRAVPASLVVDNSPCFPRNYHLKTDIEDFHWYNAFPRETAAFRATTDAFAERAAFPWSPHGDAEKRGDEPLICSEFGVWGLPHPRDLKEKDGREPWWFESGHDWNGGAATPHGVETRFRDLGLARIFGDLDGFVDQAQETQFRGLKAQIEALRWREEISGYVITELNDTQWEANGLMDARNNKRRFADRLAELQTPCLALARTPRTALEPGERFEINLRLVGPHAARIRWRFLDASGETAAPATLKLKAPEGAGLVNFEMEAVGPDGAGLSRNRLELCLVPALDAAPALTPLDDGAAALLAALRWPHVGEAGAGLATRLTTPVRERLLAGQKVVLVANDDDALTDPARKLPASDRHNFPRMMLRKRDGSYWDGRWMGAFGWRRTDGPWAALPGGPMLDEHFGALIPNHVLTGFLSTAYAGLVDAGVSVAWLHHTAAVAMRTRLGPGRLSVTTFALTGAGAQNPLAAPLLAAVVDG
jgi:hypothetical protein